MNYFDTTLSQVQTEHMLTSRGLPLGNTVLLQAGIFPIEYPYPVYDRDTHTLAPDGDPTPNAEGTAYVQRFVVVDLPLDVARANLKSRIAASRYEAEMSGVDWTDADGATVRLGTDVDSRTRLQSALDACPEGGTIQYKLIGEFRIMTRTELVALRDVVSAHVQACFDKEAAMFAEIDSAKDVKVLETINWKDDWPGEGGEVG